MKDYSNYYPSYNEKNIGYLKIMFEKQLQGNEGETVDIDSQTNVKVIIQEHTNPLNELKEDRKILISNTVLVYRGSIIKWNNEKWIIVNDVSESDDNGVYLTCKMIRAFSKLRWQDKNTNNIIEYPCIATAQLLYTLGISDNKIMTVPDGRMNLTITWDDNTSKIYEGMRFIFNSYKIFKVTYIDTITQPKLMSIMLEEDTEISGDNFKDNLAYNGKDIILPPTTPNYTVQISGDNDIQVNYSKQYTAIVYNNSVEVVEPVIWSIDNPTNASITINGNTCTVQGLVEDTYVLLICKLVKDNSVVCNKQIYIKGAW